VDGFDAAFGPDTASDGDCGCADIIGDALRSSHCQRWQGCGCGWCRDRWGRRRSRQSIRFRQHRWRLWWRRGWRSRIWIRRRYNGEWWCAWHCG
jgi:hypothetical protein